MKHTTLYIHIPVATFERDFLEVKEVVSAASAFAVVEVHDPDNGNGAGTAILKISIPYIDIYSEAVNEKVAQLVWDAIDEAIG